MSDVPPGFRWTQDRDFLGVAAGEFLLAVGVDEQTVRPLGGLRPMVERWERMEAELEQQSGPATAGDHHLQVPDALDRMSPSERSRFDDEIAHALSVGLPIADQVLARLDQQRIRTEIFGMNRKALDGALEDLRSYAASEGWRGQDAASIDEHMAWIESRHQLETAPQKASLGEVRRIVAILRRMPHRTLRRITKVTNAPALMAMVGGLLTSLHSSSIGSSTDKIGDDGVGREDSAASRATFSVSPDGDLDGPGRRRGTPPGWGAGADAPHGPSAVANPTSAPTGPSAASRERRGSDQSPSRTLWREPTYESRWALRGWMSLIGIVPTVVLIGLAAAGAGMPIAGGVAAAVGLAAVLALTVIAFGGKRSRSSQQRALRSATAGGMLAVWGAWNFAVGLVPLAVVLSEGGNWSPAVLGGVLAGVGIVMGLVGTVQRTIARKRADLPSEQYVPMNIP